ncbi:unnamed protein product [marine sediment metagenome]|uniref:Uncharacterized protein n=1 Tax=marine sediment metagenome TaxID=412755 RepID=X1HTP8_9ZZZZ|nr:MAG: hypothetical protein CEE43_12090 [Candidatus Lokiarchaeota archaeon Loki_b32]
MDLERLQESVERIKGIIKYICSHLRFSASEIEDNCKIARTTVNRYLKIWCNEKYIIWRKNRDSRNNSAYKEYEVTEKGLVIFSNFLSAVISI